MRWSLSIQLLVLLLLVGTAFAKPKIAVAPLDGDKDNEVGELIVDVAADHGRAIDPGRVGKEMDNLSITALQGKQVTKLRVKLEADLLVYGKVSKKHVSLTIAGKKKTKLEIDYKTNKDLKKQLQTKLGKQLDAALEAPDKPDEDEDEEDAKPFGGGADDKKKNDGDDKRGKNADDDKRGKNADDDKRGKNADDDDKRGKNADDDDKQGKKRTAKRDDKDVEDLRDDGEDRPKRKRKKGKRHAVTQAAAWLDAGPAFARRTLTYQATGMMQPPRVGTIAAAGEIAGELYPASFSMRKGPIAAIGLAAAYGQTLGLGIRVPKTTVVTPISQGFYWVGARYRFVFGSSSVAVGASYWRRYYLADRSKLMMPEQLDMPDVDYTAIAPDVTARIAAASNVSVFASLQVPLMLSSGPIQANTSYGPSTILAFDARAGIQLAFGSHYVVQMALAFDQIGIKFDGKAGSQSQVRAVTAATDRSIGLAATLGVFY